MSRAWMNMAGGTVLIAVGLITGGSIFYGNPTTLDYILDLFGICLIGLGIVQTVRSRRRQ